jgi:hypothetical protein
MFESTQGRRPTYNTLIARRLLDRWVPEAMREVVPEPEPLVDEAPAEVAGCSRRVEAILNGGEKARAADWRNQLHRDARLVEAAERGGEYMALGLAAIAEDNWRKRCAK